jgi:hypothetical protein
MVTQYALRSIQQLEDEQGLIPNKSTKKIDDVDVHFSGKYSLVVSNEILQSMRDGNKIYVNWHSDEQRIKKNNDRYCLEGSLVNFILSKLELLDSREFHNGYRLEGYTRITTISDDGTKILLYAHPSFQGKAWYDWVYVHFEEINAAGDAVENYYPARILGFVNMNNITEAVVHCSEKPVH